MTDQQATNYSHDTLNGDKSTLQLLNTISALRKENARLRREVVTDPLTGLANRRGFRYSLYQGSHHSVILMDLDGLGALNKEYGHDAGDEVLTTFADFLRELSPSTRWARLGGDEFAGLSLAVTPFMRHELENYRDPEYGNTVSFGVANFQPGVPRSEALSEADLFMRAAKAAHYAGTPEDRRV